MEITSHQSHYLDGPTHANFFERWSGAIVDHVVLAMTLVLMILLLGMIGLALGVVLDLAYLTVLIGERGQTLGQMLIGVPGRVHGGRRPDRVPACAAPRDLRRFC